MTFTTLYGSEADAATRLAAWSREQLYEASKLSLTDDETIATLDAAIDADNVALGGELDADVGFYLTVEDYGVLAIEAAAEMAMRELDEDDALALEARFFSLNLLTMRYGNGKYYPGKKD